MGDRPDTSRSTPLALPRDLYLPETGPAPTKVRRPKHVLPIPPELYVRENDRRQQNDKK